MKASERQKLKQNEFVETAMRVADWSRAHQTQLMPAVIGVLVVAVAVGGYGFWHRHRADRAGALLGVAMALEQAPIAPPSNVPGAKQVAGTYPTEQARSEAVLKALQDVIDQYPSTAAATAARYQMGAEYLALDRPEDARTAFADVAANAGSSSIYAAMARMGEAEALVAAKKYDEAAKIYNDLAAERDGAIPVDGVLMQLASTEQQSGKTADARATYKRIVDEFPDSPYVTDAQQKIAALN
jgi:outer membrane protein assembly factor BamD (BamD/ComL family)